MFEFLKALFYVSEKYKLGAVFNPVDRRDILLVSFQAPVALPDEYIPDISMLPVTNQRAHGSCVGQAEGTPLADFDLKENGNVDVSRRYLYAKSKLEDGFAGQGTIPRVTANIISKIGATTSKFVPDDNFLPYGDYVSITETEALLKDARVRKANYAFVIIDPYALKQAIIQNRFVTITIGVDWSCWRRTKLKAPKNIAGYHRVVLFGWRGDSFYFRNSWSGKWGSNGNGKFDWSDYKNHLYDAHCYTDIPNDLLEKAQSEQYQFTKTMKIGESDFEVKKLQERLNVVPATGYFGTMTKNKVVEFQMNAGLIPDGVVGPATIAELNKKISKLDVWCEAIKTHEGWFPGSRSYVNRNPGNIKFVGQKKAVGKDGGGFCIFATYADGYQELKDMLVRAATPPDSATYQANMSLQDFFRRYAPAGDNNDPDRYAEAVAKKLGVGVGVPISSLII